MHSAVPWEVTLAAGIVLAVWFACRKADFERGLCAVVVGGVWSATTCPKQR